MCDNTGTIRSVLASILIIIACGASASANFAAVQRISIDIPAPVIQTMSDGAVLQIEDYGMTSKPYHPMLPAKTFFIEVPDSAKNIRASLIGTDSISLGRYDVRPCPPPMPCGYIKEPEPDVDLPEIFPGEIYHFAGIKYLDGHKLAAIIAYPLQYNTKTKELTYYSRLEFSITYDRGVSTAPQHRSSVFENLAEQIIHDYDVPKRLSASGSGGPAPTYIIITSSGLEDVLQPLADWKTKKGVPAKIYNTTWIYDTYPGNDTAEQIRNFLKDMEDDHGIDWVLLAGDDDVVPIRSVYCDDGFPGDGNYVPTDYYYADLTGTWDADGDHIYGEFEDDLDWLPEVYVGRLTASAPETMEELVTNILNYEKNPPSGSWFNRSILAGGKLDDSTDEALLMKYIKDDFTDPAGFTTERINYLTNHPRDYELNYTNFKSRNDIGEAITVWSGHGSYTTASCKTSGPVFVGKHTDPTNDGKKPLVYADSCLNGGFNIGYDCLGEDVLKGWGIGFIGASKVSWYCSAWYGPSCGAWSQGMNYRFWEQFFMDQYRPGQSFYNSKVDCISDFPDCGPENRTTIRKNFFAYNLLGDPEIPIWTGAPKNFTVDKPSVIHTGSQSIVVGVSSSAPVENAIVCIQKDGDGIYEVASTDAYGKAEFIIAPYAGTLNVTVTKHNFSVYEGTICARLCGDVDGNDVVNMADMKLLQDHVFNPARIVDMSIEDVDGNGVVNILDVRLLLNHVLDPDTYLLNCK